MIFGPIPVTFGTDRVEEGRVGDGRRLRRWLAPTRPLCGGWEPLTFSQAQDLVVGGSPGRGCSASPAETRIKATAARPSTPEGPIQTRSTPILYPSVSVRGSRRGFREIALAQLIILQPESPQTVFLRTHIDLL